MYRLVLICVISLTSKNIIDPIKYAIGSIKNNAPISQIYDIKIIETGLFAVYS